MMSANFSNFLTPSPPLLEFGSDLHYKMRATSLYYVRFSIILPDADIIS